MKTRASKIIIRKSFTLCVILTGLTFLFTSCENFMKATSTKEELERALEYANADSYSITVDYKENTGTVRSPVGGVADKKVYDVFSVYFEPSSQYAFVSWKIVDSATGKELKNGDYLKLESINDKETTCTFMKKPEAGMKLCLCPVLAERPQIISFSPQNARNMKDSPIQVLFDFDMDQYSIYYTAEELAEFKKDSSITLLDEVTLADGTKTTYGYKKDGNIYYKNISIINKKTKENLLRFFGTPVLENGLLSIPPNREEGDDNIIKLTDFSQVLVSIENGFFYTKDNNNNVYENGIMMYENKKWMYQTNNHTDEKALALKVLQFMDENGTPLNLQKSVSWYGDSITLLSNNNNGLDEMIFLDNKLKLNLQVEEEEEGSGPTDTFAIELKYAANDKYLYFNDWDNLETTRIEINYDEVEAQSAKFNGIIDFSKEGVTLKEGLYIINIIIYDKNNNWRSTCNFFGVDHTPVTPVSISTIIPDGTSECKYTFGWKSPDWDIKKTTIYYKLGSNPEEHRELLTSDEPVTQFELELQPGQLNEFYLEFEDFNGNISKSYDSSKPVSETNRKFVIHSNVLTQKPQKMPYNYMGTVEQGLADTSISNYKGLYFKFGDFPQSKKADSVNIVSPVTIKDCGFNHSETTYSIGDDGYLYKKIIDCKTNQPTWFKVEPIVWRYLTKLNSPTPTLPNSGSVMLLAENVLIASNKDVGVPYYKNNLQSVYRTINGHSWGPKYYPYSTLCAYLKSRFEDGDPQAQTTNSSYAENGFSESAFTKVDGKITEIRILTKDETSDTQNDCKNLGLDYSKLRIRTATDYAVATGASRNSQWWITDDDLCSFIAYNGTSGAGANYDNESTGIVPAITVPGSILPSN